MVVAKLGDAAVAGKADAYIDARFEILVEDAAKDPAGDPFRKHMIQQDANTASNPAAEARAKMLADFNSTQPAK